MQNENLFHRSADLQFRFMLWLGATIFTTQTTEASQLGVDWEEKLICKKVGALVVPQVT